MTPLRKRRLARVKAIGHFLQEKGYMSKSTDAYLAAWVTATNFNAPSAEYTKAYREMCRTVGESLLLKIAFEATSNMEKET